MRNLQYPARSSRPTRDLDLAVEDPPADVVPESLVVDHEVPDGRRQPITLPLAFQPSGFFAALD
jgi:hypothetical protein